MIQINDDYYEDLTPESVVTLLKALQASIEATAATGNNNDHIGRTPDTAEAVRDHESGVGEKVGSAGQVKVPAPGPQGVGARKTCEPKAGLTALVGEKWGTEKFRTDGAF